MPAQVVIYLQQSIDISKDEYHAKFATKDELKAIEAKLNKFNERLEAVSADVKLIKEDITKIKSDQKNFVKNNSVVAIESIVKTHPGGGPGLSSYNRCLALGGNEGVTIQGGFGECGISPTNPTDRWKIINR